MIRSQIGVLLLLVFLRNGDCTFPLAINTWGFTSATQGAWDALSWENGTAVVAVVAGCEVCEREQCDGTVGYGGSPDENGETTLDAQVFDGSTMKVGAVAQLRNCRHAIRAAYHVLCQTEHTLLAGSLATDFAKEMGLEIQSLSTPRSELIYQKWLQNKCQPNFWKKVTPDPKTSCGPYSPINTVFRPPPNPYVYNQPSVRFSSKNHDTIGMIVIDKFGNIAAGTSTNGANHKIPGRVGDSPIPGSGAYASNKIGAAVATGDGDILMRFSPSIMAVQYLAAGLSTNEAAQKALELVVEYYPGVFAGIVVVTNKGEYGAACSGMPEFPYSVRSEKTNGVQVVKVKCFNHIERDELK